eukprot:SAG31_NODE_4247_length_3420_cov_2.633243_3_plen_103_part_00
MTTVIEPAVKAIGIEPSCFDMIWGQDSPELKKTNYEKGALIEQVMKERSWSKAEVLFVDDSDEHIIKAAAVCQTLHVAGNGMSPSDLVQIRQFAGVLTKSPQ